ncbi:hypothetical protein [Anianabacter salinae]|uniref:hypothetical protein n=1 Tax=Anianabacter salinae TaxID=2851023 RepID=UPI00225E002C|nr:hypothetical protein [Anianabacter salinae]MBV0910832.1 hypothetical protein [Anianabacter salinae]
MKHGVVVVLCLGLSACDSPSPSMWGADAARVEVDGATFNVRAQRGKAEAIRIGWDARIARASMVARGVTAIELATGCAVIPRSVEGDTNIVKAAIRCPRDQVKLSP